MDYIEHAETKYGLKKFETIISGCREKGIINLNNIMGFPIDTRFFDDLVYRLHSNLSEIRRTGVEKV